MNSVEKLQWAHTATGDTHTHTQTQRYNDKGSVIRWIYVRARRIVFSCRNEIQMLEKKERNE